MKANPADLIAYVPPGEAQLAKLIPSRLGNLDQMRFSCVGFALQLRIERPDRGQLRCDCFDFALEIPSPVFPLHWSCRRTHRPNFFRAGPKARHGRSGLGSGKSCRRRIGSPFNYGVWPYRGGRLAPSWLPGFRPVRCT